jgi:hypothetical protein
MLLALASAVFLESESLGLATIFYSLRFETSLFFASYDSQGHGEGVRPRLHTGELPPVSLQYVYIERRSGMVFFLPIAIILRYSFYTLTTEQLCIEVTFETCIVKVLGSNIGRATNSPDSGSSCSS